MGWLSEISLKAREAEVLLGQRAPSPVRRWYPTAFPDLEYSQIQVFLQYREVAQKLGVNLKNKLLLDTINGHPHRIEDAFLCLLEYSDKLEDGDHATNFLRKAFIEGWKPRKFQSFEQARKAIPWL
ncbi:hypothetical protein [Iningainema tapete]|uniref:Uncharacterized protein n=1 Tax=Iningainema tapete BLCC-T55 TaxID=2748662 RepID=A0A8J7BWI0_9CYAN|nr:hypothetical protein [Iningainema tapete]MBD2770988.1 hypothetical protein [Iningainema tapete BLCC-T55]